MKEIGLFTSSPVSVCLHICESGSFFVVKKGKDGY